MAKQPQPFLFLPLFTNVVEEVFCEVREYEILGSSPRASVDGIMLVVERVDPPGVSGTERRRKRAHGAPQAVTSLPPNRGTFQAGTPANPNQ
jgi:hypothetical protein